jgi:hypothetical protein
VTTQTLNDAMDTQKPRMQTDKIEELAVRQIVLEALLMATLAQVGRADFKTFSTANWGTFLDNITTVRLSTEQIQLVRR